MFICVCKAVSDKRIQRAVSDGASTLRELSRDLGVGTCCGKCVPDARRALGEALVQQAPLKLRDLTALEPAFG